MQRQVPQPVLRAADRHERRGGRDVLDMVFKRERAQPGMDGGAAHVTENEGQLSPARKRGRLVPIPVIAGVLAVIGSAALVVFLTGYRGATHTASVTVPVSKNPFGVALDAGTRTVYVTNSGDNTVSVIDGSTRAVAATVPVGKKPEGVALDPGTHTVYVANSEDNTVSVIDGPTRTLAATAWAGTYPDGVAVDPGTHTVYVANSGNATVSVIDGSTHTVTATVHVGGRPLGVAVDPNTHTVYVTDSHGWTVSVIDGRKNTVTATMAEKPRDIRRVEFGGMAPWGLAVDPGSHTVYVTNRGDHSVWVIERR